METLCIACLKPGDDSATWRECGICLGDLCRECAIFLDEASFPFLDPKPAALAHSFFCADCHEAHVVPAQTEYEAALDRARRTYFFYEGRKPAIPYLSKAKAEVKVDDCVDRNETILRLAFQAQAAGYNAIIHAEVGHEKVRMEGWQKTKWIGRGTPAQVDSERLDRPFAY
jgi:hypothetical protein